MTSKISSFKLAKEDMCHRVWMLALSILGNLLSMPVWFLLINHRITERLERYSSTTPTLYLTDAYKEFVTDYLVAAQGFVLMAGAVIVALFGFRYLYSRRMVDLYHAMPVKRTRMFFVTYLDGFLIWFVPMLLSMLLMLLLLYTNLARFSLTALFGSLCGQILWTMVKFVLAFLITYHFTLVCVMLSGNIFNAICSTLLGGTLIFALDFLLTSGYAETFFETFYRTDDTPLYLWSILSPVVNAILVLDGHGTALFWVGSVLSPLLCLAGAWQLYLRRPSELAEHGIENPLTQHILRITASLLAGLLGAFLFIGILGNTATAWHLFGAIFTGIFCFGLLNCVFSMNFRCFLTHKLEMAGTILLTCIILLAFKGDWFGYDEYLPDKEALSSASVYIYPYSDSTYGYDNPAVTGMTYTNTDVIHSLLAAFTDPSHRGRMNSAYEPVFVTVTLQNGRTYSRQYRALAEDAELLRPLIESEEYLHSAYAFSSGISDYPPEVSISPVYEGLSYSVTDPEQIQLIVDAYRTDFAEHSSLEDLSIELRVGHLNIWSKNDNYSKRAFEAGIQPHCEHTIAAIHSIFPEMVLQEEDLEIASITVNTTYDSRYSPDVLYSYFGIEGYEAFDSYVNRMQEESSAKQSTAPDVATTTHYQLTLNTEEDIEDLRKYLFFGDIDVNNLYTEKLDYVYFGEAYTSKGYSISCYVKHNELPLTYIERLAASAQ